MKISIITPTMNSEATIESNIHSIQKQTFINYEQIFVDGSSSDSTISIIKEKKKDSDILISEPDQGIYDAINKGIIHSSGDIIGVLNSDDLFTTNNILQKIHNKFEQKCLDFLYGDIKYINHKNDTVRYWKSKLHSKRIVTFGWMPPHPSFYISRNTFEKFGLYNLNYSISSDYEYMLKILLDDTLKYDYLDCCMVDMLIGGASNRSIQAVIKKSSEDISILKKYSKFPTIAFLNKNISKISQFLKK
jgi:glycosyltransferase